MRVARRNLVLGLLALLLLFVPRASADTFAIPDPNIIGFANATSCGGSTLCNNGSAFNLSQIGSWLSTPTSAQSYLVFNDTGHTITSLTFIVSGQFQATNGPWENFQIQVGAPGFFNTVSLSGPGFVGYTQGPNGTSAAANFSNTGNPLAVTFTWSGGQGIPAGAFFNLQTASWVSNVGTTQVPEPSSLLLLAGGLISLLGTAAFQRMRH
jgi:hypothetical protein